MRELSPKPYPDDREIEALLKPGLQVPHRTRPSPETEKFAHMVVSLRFQVFSLTEEVRTLRQDCQTMQRDLDKLKLVVSSTGTSFDLTKAMERSMERAKRWRQDLVLEITPKETDGFSMIVGILKKHKRNGDDAVELLRRYREDE